MVSLCAGIMPTVDSSVVSGICAAVSSMIPLAEVSVVVVWPPTVFTIGCFIISLCTIDLLCCTDKNANNRQVIKKVIAKPVVVFAIKALVFVPKIDSAEVKLSINPPPFAD